MPAPVEITLWHWGGFIAVVGVILGVDLGVFNRRPRAVTFWEAAGWTVLWFAVSLLFSAAIGFTCGRRDALEYLTGYFVELSLSVDNVFVMALVFNYFRTPAALQHRVLFWGILGAVVMRGVFIWLGVQLISRFDWVLYIFGLILLASGIRMLRAKSGELRPERNPVSHFARKLFPILDDADGEHFFVRRHGRLYLTPLFLALLAVETSDLIFAADSIPAVFGVTRKTFIVFTSNVFAILGLRSLYFLLAGIIGRFRFLKWGISLVLVFIGIKMLLDPHDRPPRGIQVDIPDDLALLASMFIISVSIAASLLAPKRERPPETPQTPA